MRLALLLAGLCACFPTPLPKDAPEAPPSDEPWVKEHIAIGKAACDCEDSQCLETAKAKLDALEAEHGGLDESPADVHKSRGEFETCYRTGTKDPVRDMEAVADQMCRCSQEACVDKSLIDRLRFDEKYTDADLTADQKAAIARASESYEECKSKKILDADELALHVERVAKAVCACASGSGCGLELTGLPEMPIAPKLTGRIDEARDRIKSAKETMCNCAVNGGVDGTYGGLNTRACPREEK